MTCYKPLKAYRSGERTSTGRLGITFNPVKSYVEGYSLSVPCGQCIGCRLDKSAQWAARCMHEAQLHNGNSFVTLTYSPDKLPEDLGLRLRDLQLFFKRLRKRAGQHLRYYAAGEYSDQNLRPHYHALVFGYWPSDAARYKQTEHGDWLYRSAFLDDVWQHGMTFTGSVTYKSAAYVARYVMKKANGDHAATRYMRHDPEGKPYWVPPEFSVMSRRPGIGAGWFDRYKTDAFPSDFLIADGKRIKVPNYYTNKLKEDELSKIKNARKRKSLKHRADQTPARLAVREEVATARTSKLQRKL